MLLAQRSIRASLLRLVFSKIMRKVDSNHYRSAYEADVLPLELFRIEIGGDRIERPRTDFQSATLPAELPPVVRAPESNRQSHGATHDVLVHTITRYFVLRAPYPLYADLVLFELNPY